MSVGNQLRNLAYVAFAIAFVAIVLQVWSARVTMRNLDQIASIIPDSPQEIARQQAEAEKVRRIYAGGRYYKPLRVMVDYSGVEQPELMEATAVDLPATTPIIGVDVDGQSCAFVVDSMLTPDRHIVNLLINNIPLSVTYCDIVDRVRVLTSNESKLIPLNVGGLDVDNSLVLLLGGERYSHASKDLPLEDFDFVRMTLQQWKELHPSTMVYVGASDSNEKIES